MEENKNKYNATKDLIGKLDKIVDWCEHITVEDRNEDFFIDHIQTLIDELKEESIFFLKLLN